MSIKTDKPIVAIVAGGYSGEYEVSLRSASGIYSWIDKTLYSPYIYVIDKDKWWVQLPDNTKGEVDRATFAFSWQGEVYQPSYAYITIHGTPGEDGILQGYLELLGIPYNTGGVLTESLTFNKFHCNRYLSTISGVRVAPSVRLLSGAPCPSEEDVIAQLGLPLFVKPNTGGSSVATSRVEAREQLSPAVELALHESQEVILERFISGVEVTCGAYALDGVVYALPITEVVPKNEFFDFDAKYNGQVEEITPARISPEQTAFIQELTKKIYQEVDAQGIIRVDYIIETDGMPTLLEVNTTPGMTPTSFIPQQVRAAGLDISQLLTGLIRQGLCSSVQ